MKTLIGIILAGTAAALAPQALSAAVYDGWHSVRNGNQPVVTGSGRVVRQVRPVGDFRALELMGFYDVQLRLGAAPSLVIEADDNLLPYFTSNVSGGTLRLGTRGSLRTRSNPKVYLTVTDVNSVLSMGSGNLVVSNVANRRLELVTRGSGNMRAQGRTGDLTVMVQGSGNADMRGLNAGRSEVSVMGSGNAWVSTTGALSARSFGSGNVYVLGRPSSLQVTQAGSGRVIRPVSR